MKNNRSLFRKELEWLSLAKKYINEDNFSYYTNYVRDAAFDLFYDGENLKKEFLYLIPVGELAKVRYTIDILKSISGMGMGEWSGHRGSMKKSVLLENIDSIEKIMKRELSFKSNFNIFYSWQSDINSKYNRNFIEDCLKIAIDKANENSEITLTIDKKTIGEPGSPDIANIILQKIDMSLGFIADITPIIATESKHISNPNVMLELGYALSSLSDERVILICNTSTCSLKDLPFDLGLKRIVTYCYDETTDSITKKEQKEKLVNVLCDALKAILEM